MLTKLPFVPDVSHYNGSIDWSQVTPRPVLGIAKATEGNYYKDNTFLTNWHGLQVNRLPRMAYHFHRKANSEFSQAAWFIDFVKQGGVTSDDMFALDVEEGGETAAQLREWITYVQSAFPYNQVFIYSRKNILDPISFLLSLVGIPPQHPLNSIKMTQSDRDFFTKIPVWTAGYPNNPDLYSSVPAFYVPDQTKWGPVLLWQYSEHGAISGIPGETDMNWIEPTFAASLSSSSPLPPASVPYPGMEYYKFQHASGVNVYVLLIDMQSQKRAKVVYAPNLKTVTQFATEAGAQVAINGQEWDKDLPGPWLPGGVCVSDGQVIYNPKNGEPFLNITQSNQLSLPWNNYTGLYNAVSGFRYLVENGLKHTSLDDPSKLENTELHARGGKGITTDGRLMLAGCDGLFPHSGLTLSQFADVFMQFKARAAADFDSGGSFALRIGDTIVNQPSDGHERAVVSALLIFSGENPMSDIDHYEYTATGSRAIRTDHGAQFPRIDSGSSKSYFNTNTKAKGGATLTDRYILPDDVFQNGTKIGAKNDVWVRLYDNNGVLVDGWTAKVHMGQPQITEVFVPATTPPIPPPTGTSTTIKVDYDGTGAVSGVNVDGTAWIKPA